MKDLSRRFVRTIRRRVHASKKALAWALTCTVGLSLAELARPWPLKIIFDNILGGRPLPALLSPLAPLLAQSKSTAVVVVASFILVIAVVTGLLAYSQVHVTARLGNQMVYTLRRQLFTHLQHLSLSFHNRAKSGELLTKMASDTTTLKDVFAESFVEVFSQVLTLVGMLVLMLVLDARLSIVVLATLPILGTTLYILYRKAGLIARKQRKKEEKIATRISEVMSSVPLVQAFGRERYEEQRFQDESEDYLEESIRSDRIEGAAARAVEFISAAGTFVVVLFGSLAILDGKLTIGTLLVFTSYLHGMYRPIRNMAKLSTKLSKAAVSAGRISDILEEDPVVPDPSDAVEPTKLRGEIEFENVSFGYEEGNTLRDVSFRIEPGEQVAIVGSSGAGKSTLIKLLIRLYEPEEGAVKIDGVDIRKYKREALRQRIGLVLQDALLFGSTIRENIVYGKLDATEDEIVAAATAANAHDFIEQLPQGYDTVVSERGTTLSGGQQQRIAIARALVRNPAILILDEPTTGLDPESEAKLKEALDHLMKDKTCLLITHDVWAVAASDRVLLLDGGRLAETGTHDELKERSEVYRRIFDLDNQEATKAP